MIDLYLITEQGHFKVSTTLRSKTQLDTASTCIANIYNKQLETTDWINVLQLRILTNIFKLEGFLIVYLPHEIK